MYRILAQKAKEFNLFDLEKKIAKYNVMMGIKKVIFKKSSKRISNESNIKPLRTVENKPTFKVSSELVVKNTDVLVKLKRGNKRNKSKKRTLFNLKTDCNTQIVTNIDYESKLNDVTEQDINKDTEQTTERK